jgi:hypothetical protein
MTDKTEESAIDTVRPEPWEDRIPTSGHFVNGNRWALVAGQVRTERARERREERSEAITRALPTQDVVFADETGLEVAQRRSALVGPFACRGAR